MEGFEKIQAFWFVLSAFGRPLNYDYYFVLRLLHIAKHAPSLGILGNNSESLKILFRVLGCPSSTRALSFS